MNETEPSGPRFPQVRSKLPARGSARARAGSRVVDVVVQDMHAAGVPFEARVEFIRASSGMNYPELVKLAGDYVTVIE